MSKLVERFKHLLSVIDSLSLRERLFVFAAMIIVIGGLWEALLAGPLEAREDAARAKIQGSAERLAKLDESIAIAAGGLNGGMTDQVDRLKALRQALAAQEETVQVFTSDLVDPAQMRVVIEDLLKGQQGLKLIRAANLEVEAVVDAELEGGQKLPAQAPKLYRHGLTLELEGSYLACLDYLKKVEGLPWQIYWSRLDLETIEYPRIKISIELNTLSLDEEWIGV
jgi:MSHA biogenesis protein MshJ